MVCLSDECVKSANGMILAFAETPLSCGEHCFERDRVAKPARHGVYPRRERIMHLKTDTTFFGTPSTCCQQ